MEDYFWKQYSKRIFDKTQGKNGVLRGWIAWISFSLLILSLASFLIMGLYYGKKNNNTSNEIDYVTGNENESIEEYFNVESSIDMSKEGKPVLKLSISENNNLDYSAVDTVNNEEKRTISWRWIIISAIVLGIAIIGFIIVDVIDKKRLTDNFIDMLKDSNETLGELIKDLYGIEKNKISAKLVEQIRQLFEEKLTNGRDIVKTVGRVVIGFVSSIYTLVLAIIDKKLIGDWISLLFLFVIVAVSLLSIFWIYADMVDNKLQHYRWIIKWLKQYEIYLFSQSLIGEDNLRTEEVDNIQGSTEPQKTEPQKTEPQKTGPQKTGPQKTGPQKTEPQKTSGKNGKNIK